MQYLILWEDEGTNDVMVEDLEEAKEQVETLLENGVEVDEIEVYEVKRQLDIVANGVELS